MDSMTFPPDRLLQWANVVYLVSLATAVVASVAICQLSARVTAAKDRELEEYRTESTIKITAAQAQLELANLKRPRTIAPEDQEKIITVLKEFEGQEFSFSVFGDPESLALLRVLDVMLRSAGWLRVPSQIGAIVVDVAGNTAGTSHDSGVAAFIGPDYPNAQPALLALSKALTDAGIPCLAYQTEQLRDKTPKAIVINVGEKPISVPRE